MFHRIKKLVYSAWRKPLGMFCIIIGFLALVTPFTPGSWLIFVGLELLGIRLFLGKRWKRFLRK